MAKIDIDKFVVALVETYSRAHGVDRSKFRTWLDRAIEEMGYKVENGRLIEISVFDEMLDRPVEDYPTLGKRALRCLKCANINTLRQLVRTPRADLLKVPKLGKGTLSHLDDFLEDHNLKWGG